MGIKKAREVMIPLDSYPHIPYWFTLSQAVAALEKAEFDVGGQKSLPRCVLVFNESYDLLGMVRRRDILRGLKCESLAEIILPEVVGHASEPSGLALSKRIQDNLQRQVSDVMRPIKDSVKHDDNIINVACMMVDGDLSFIPVMKDNKVIGVVRTVEIVKELARLGDARNASPAPTRPWPPSQMPS